MTLQNGSGLAQAPSTPTAEEIERQIEALQAQLQQRRIAEAQAAIAAEAAAADQARLASQQATAARMYLASVNAPQSQQLQGNTRDTVPQDENADGAVEVVTTTEPDGTVREERRYTQESLRDGESTTKFGGIDFGVGIAFSYDLGGERRVREAAVVNDIVRVTRADNARARLILESHYFFTPTGRSLFGLRNDPPGTENGVQNWGIGPFIALQPGSDTIIDAIGGGVMMGFRRSGEGNDSFNIGIGALYDIDVRVLGPGVLENQPLPAGETEIRFQQREQGALLLISSYSF